MNNHLKRFFQPYPLPLAPSIALLALRLIVGAAFLFYGWGKIINPFGWMGPDAAIPGFFQALAAISEFGGALALISGLLVPLASLGIAITMVVATWVVASMGAPFVSMEAGGIGYDKPAILLGVALVTMLLGPGKLSLDKLIFGERPAQP
jgi:putative oxidoreductase